MITVLPARAFREGRWLNGMGVSWDIAAEPAGAGVTGFDWRFAIARIDADVPFSRYDGIDRVFTLLAGDGLTLDLAGQPSIIVRETHVPYAFPGDVKTVCRLQGGPCRALNLFLARGTWSAEVAVHGGAGEVPDGGTSLLFALAGDVRVGDSVLCEGDAAVATGGFAFEAGQGRLYVARLSHIA